jgi:LysM repeat protein
VSLEEAPPPPKAAPAPAVRASAETHVPSRTAVPPSAKRPVVYTVKRGDNLTRLAARDGSTLAELAALNGTTVKKLSNLKVGQKIKLKNGID